MAFRRCCFADEEFAEFALFGSEFAACAAYEGMYALRAFSVCGGKATRSFAASLGEAGSVAMRDVGRWYANSSGSSACAQGGGGRCSGCCCEDEEPVVVDRNLSKVWHCCASVAERCTGLRRDETEPECAIDLSCCLPAAWNANANMGAAAAAGIGLLRGIF